MRDDWLPLALAAALAAAAGLWLTRRARRALRERVRRAARQAIRDFRARIAHYKLVSPRVVRDELVQDPVILQAVRDHASAHATPEHHVRRRVDEYIDEIVPFFNVLTYYRFGYNLARAILRLFYHVTVAYQDEAALSAIPKQDVLVYLPNHRSNMDYVVLAYVLARRVSVSYAVGEWARTWPLEYIFKAFGSYFIRRGYREPLYHAVLERYVQLITRNGVAQGVFLEGGLSRDGRFRPAKIGLLDYMVRTLREPGFQRDIWLVPVAINYDRVLEDRVLIRERLEGVEPPGRLGQLAGVLQYGWLQALRLLTRRRRRHGRAGVAFGTPVSVRAWLQTQPAHLLDRPRPERLPHVQRLADEMLERVRAIIPVTPVALGSAALLSFEAAVVSESALLERLDELRDQLIEGANNVVQRGESVHDLWERAWRMLSMRRLVVRDGDAYVILPRQRPVLEYYANSIHHLFPPQLTPWHKEHEADRTLPRLRPSEPSEGAAPHRAAPDAHPPH